MSVEIALFQYRERGLCFAHTVVRPECFVCGKYELHKPEYSKIEHIIQIAQHEYTLQDLQKCFCLCHPSSVSQSHFSFSLLLSSGAAVAATITHLAAQTLCWESLTGNPTKSFSSFKKSRTSLACFLTSLLPLSLSLTHSLIHSDNCRESSKVSQAMQVLSVSLRLSLSGSQTHSLRRAGLGKPIIHEPMRTINSKIHICNKISEGFKTVATV